MASTDGAAQTPSRPSAGRDEMNLAEFPLGVLSDRVPERLQTLIFRDRVRHPKTGESIDRVLKITPSGEYGLPTAQDDEVILGLIQLTKLKTDFASRQVEFTRHELIRLMRWPRRGWSYRRLSESLNRWVGVTLYYQNAWWNPEEQTWVDEKFHILDNVSEPDGPRLPVTVTWNQVVVRDIRQGNLKRLDLDFYFGLAHAGSKRAYRFLDKRFHRRDRLEFELREFACNHIGLSNRYHTGELKRRLRPILSELEDNGFLHPLPPAQRFVKVRRGEWRVIVRRARPPRHQVPMDGDGLFAELTRRQVNPAVAAELVRDHDENRIRQKTEVLDWLVRKRDPRVSRNPAGYLVASIRDDYTAPAGYESPPQRQARQAENVQRRQAAEQHVQSVEHERIERHQAVDGWLASQPLAERQAIEKAALAEDGNILVKQYRRATDDQTRETLHRIILRAYAARLIDQTGRIDSSNLN